MIWCVVGGDCGDWDPLTVPPPPGAAPNIGSFLWPVTLPVDQIFQVAGQLMGVQDLSYLVVGGFLLNFGRRWYCRFFGAWDRGRDGLEKWDVECRVNTIPGWELKEEGYLMYLPLDSGGTYEVGTPAGQAETQIPGREPVPDLLGDRRRHATDGHLQSLCVSALPAGGRHGLSPKLSRSPITQLERLRVLRSRETEEVGSRVCTGTRRVPWWSAGASSVHTRPREGNSSSCAGCHGSRLGGTSPSPVSYAQSGHWSGVISEEALHGVETAVRRPSWRPLELWVSKTEIWVFCGAWKWGGQRENWSHGWICDRSWRILGSVGVPWLTVVGASPGWLGPSPGPFGFIGTEDVGFSRTCVTWWRYSASFRE